MKMDEVKTIKEAIKFILKEGKGFRDDLIKEVGSESIVNELAQLGYISQGATVDDNSVYHRTWKKTQSAENYASFFINELTKEEKDMGLYLHSIGF